MPGPGFWAPARLGSPGLDAEPCKAAGPTRGMLRDWPVGWSAACFMAITGPCFRTSILAPVPTGEPATVPGTCFAMTSARRGSGPDGSLGGSSDDSLCRVTAPRCSVAESDALPSRGAHCAGRERGDPRLDVLAAVATSTAKKPSPHWRNARTAGDHNPWVYEARLVATARLTATESGSRHWVLGNRPGSLQKDMLRRSCNGLIGRNAGKMLSSSRTLKM